MKIKLTPLDRLFSRIIKERDKWCQKCGDPYHKLETAHNFSRGKHSVRFDEENACLLCFTCHQWFDHHETEKHEFFRQRLGEQAYDLLQKRADTPQKIDKKIVELYLKAVIKEMDMKE